MFVTKMNGTEEKKRYDKESCHREKQGYPDRGKRVWPGHELRVTGKSRDLSEPGKRSGAKLRRAWGTR